MIASIRWRRRSPPSYGAEVRWIAVVALLGCSEPKLVESLIAADRWTAVASENDPYAAHRPAPGECPAASCGLEDLGGEMTLFVNTLDCAYLTVEQTSLVEVEKEDPIRVRVWHFGLDKLDGV